ncbi:MAG: type II toxin-antitoxin system RelE/ParE family toxin [Candidatus Peribacteraceae bacterium]|nr:type II toxin-antitoxin system RelE/ParE family toxin [Candidatus Peribacteraceae bacterium]MBP9850614.1 type II toxin-antitoxin system RelE/ParE family toxin [Candidatus Peribacteraceae bacterium]
MDKIEKQLRKIPERYRERIFVAIEHIMERDFIALDRKRLKGFENIFRIRIGNYRIIYHDDGEKITLKAIIKRDENAYRTF